TVFGQLRLQSANSSYTSSLSLTSGALTNAPGGVVVVNRGSGGARTITGSVWNHGLWDQNYTLALRGDHARWRNFSDWMVPADSVTLSGTGVRFDQMGGTLNLEGGFTLTGGVFRHAGGDINGQPYLVNCVLVLDTTNAPAAFTLTGNGSRLLGDLSPGQSVWVQGSNTGSHTTGVAPQGFANAGLLLLQSVNSSFTSAFRLDEGTLTNQPSGVIRTGRGNGGSRSLSIPILLNRGTLDIAHPTTMLPANALYQNTGKWTIQGGNTLALTSGQTFRQDSGALEAIGAFDGTQITFDYRGGTITGQPYLENSTLLLGPAATEPVAFTLVGSGSRLLGDLREGQSVWIQGGNRGSHTTVQAPRGFANEGLLLLQSVNSSFRSALQVNEGNLTNRPSGTIRIGQGNAGPRILSAGTILNEGLIDVNWPLSLAPAGALFRNRGTWDMEPGITLSLNNGQTFRQEAGLLNVAGGFDGTGIMFDYQGGTITGQPYLENSTLRFGPGGTEPAAFTLVGSGSRLVGDLREGQSVWIQGGSRGSHTTVVAEQGFANGGLLLLQSVNSSYTSALQVDEGDLTNLPTGVIRLGRGNAGPRNLRLNLDNRGLLDVNWGLNLGRSGATHVNQGDVLIDAAGSVTLTDGQTWTQVDGLVDIDGAFTLRDGRFDFQGGLVEGGVYLPGSRLDLSRAGLGGSFTLGKSTARLYGESTPGVTVTIQGSNDDSNTTVRAPEGFINRGTLRLASVNAAYRSSLSVEGSPLVNDWSGLVDIAAGSGGPRELEAAIVNRGSRRVRQTATLGLPGETLLNQGRFETLATATLRGPLMNAGGEITGDGSISGEVEAPSGRIQPTGNLVVNGTMNVGTGMVLDVLLGTAKLTVNGPLAFNGLVRARFP
ncbi:MAG: hypothetical protein KDM81_09015, partial [Verrucomicrobiae bacterium]|nr:hypothetical protein [Verrucomicrobiae bacterium]